MDTHKILQSVVRLVEKPDTRSLELALLNTLRDITVNRGIGLCEIHHPPGEPNKRLATYTVTVGACGVEPNRPIPLERDPVLLRCLETGETLRDRDGEGVGVRVIHPLRGPRGINGFLVFNCDEYAERDQELIAMLLTFYKNYVSLLEDSQRDKLTGLLNRKTFDDRVLQIIATVRAQEAEAAAGHGYALGVLDIDHFKSVNDRFGHLYGDEVLLLFARCMVEAFRGGDLLFRIGGEEFVVVLKDVDLERARIVFDRFRKIVEEFPFPQVGKLTASIGVSLIKGGDLPATIIDRADRALYYAKNHGRNQVQFHETLMTEGEIGGKKAQDDVELF